MNTAHLDALARSLTGPFAFCGIAVAQKGRRHLAFEHVPEISATADAMFRVASVSKLIVGQAVARLVKAKRADWAQDISELLGWPLCHPAYPDRVVTLGMATSHSAGLTDDAGYLIPLGQTVQGWCQTQPVFAAAPGVRFSYANLGYIILAEVLQRLSGRSFPEAVADLIPQPGGFNWIGVPSNAPVLPTYRKEAGQFLPQIDAPREPPLRVGHVGRFSPQGGLRLSLSGMLDLATSLPKMDHTRLWSPAIGPGDYLDGVFESYGPGLQIFDAPAFYPRPLIGHFGNAYGFNGGVWWDPQCEIAFAYALNGLAMGDEDDAFSDAERRIFDAIAELKD